MSEQLKLPKSLEKLEDLAYNLWFAWNPDARDLFREIDVDLWRTTGRNPVEILLQANPSRLDDLSQDNNFVEKVHKCWDRFQKYMDNKETTFTKNFPKMADRQIAYFCAEYGIHESLPNYAGGLGVLAGDHTKSASDLGLPFVAV